MAKLSSVQVTQLVDAPAFLVDLIHPDVYSDDFVDRQPNPKQPTVSKEQSI
jgi:hypothetical protein